MNKQTRSQSKVHTQSQVKRKAPTTLLSWTEQVIMVRLRTENNQWNTHMHKKLNMLAYLMRKIDRPRSIYSKTVKGMTASPTETTLHQKLLVLVVYNCLSIDISQHNNRTFQIVNLNLQLKQLKHS